MIHPDFSTYLDPEKEQREYLETMKAMGERFAIEAAEREAARAATAWAEDPPCLPTSVWEIVDAAVNRCVAGCECGMIIGLPGTGKTKALEEVERRSDRLEGPRAALLTITAVIGGSTMAIYDDLAPHLGVKCATSIAATQKRLMRSASFHPIIIFDEAQNLTLKSTRDLLEISKSSRIPMLFCGNDDVLKLVNSQQAAIQQISRRLPVRMEIHGITDEDADLIAEWFGVEGLDAFTICRAIGRTSHADGIATVLKNAKRLSPGSSTIRLPAIRAALELFPHLRPERAGQSVKALSTRESTLRSGRLVKPAA